MSSIVTSVLSSTVGLLWNKDRDLTADKLQDGKMTDAEIRKIVVRELSDIKSKINGRSRKMLLASYNFLQEGVDLLNVSLDKSNPEQKESETQGELHESSSDIRSGMLNQAIELPRAMEKLKINSERDFESMKEKFENARKTASTVYWNQAFSIEVRIIAAKLRIVSEILEHLDNPETAIIGCLSFLKTLHSLPPVQKMIKVYLKRGIKSRWKKTRRVENVKSIILINYLLFHYVRKFSRKCSLEVSDIIPTIELPGRSFHPITNWYEISTRKSLEKKLPHPPIEQFFDEIINPDVSAVNSQGDIFTFPQQPPIENIVIILETGIIKRVELPEFKDDNPTALLADTKNNLYVVRVLFDGRFMLTILDENHNVKAEHNLEFLTPEVSIQIRIAICQNNDIIIIYGGDPHVYVCDKACQLKYKFERNSRNALSLSISQQNEIMIPTDDDAAIQIYTKEGNLKTTMKVPDGHMVRSVAFHNEICKIMVLTWAWMEKSYFVLCYPEEGGERETLTPFDSGKMKDEGYPQLVSLPNGPGVVVKAKNITYLQ